MSINPKWLGELTGEDEYGLLEVWQFEFKRPSARTMLAFVKADAADSDNDRVELLMEALRGIIAKVTRNGEGLVRR